ncbi:LPS biosynthesis protein WbpP [Deltaproteobacteria bacterium Smac51]|nr:LPS biosynthesis protein WbpP [Deltaproteobacteria bacterium Smac51]
MSRALVTGGAGFIGSHLVDALLAHGHEVRVLDDLSTGYIANLDEAGISAGDRLEIVQGSIRDESSLDAAMDRVQAVFHLAGLVAVPESIENPLKCIDLNDLGVYGIYAAAAEHGARRVVFSSSSAIYGDLPVPHHEELCPQPDTPYAIHKLLGEHYGKFFSGYRGLETVYLRYFNVYGPRQLPDSPYSGVISIFMEKLHQGLPVTIFDDGGQTRDFVYVADVVRANLAAAFAPAERASGRAFNIGSGKAVSILNLYEHLAGLAGSRTRPVFAPPRPGDIRHSQGPISLAAECLSFRPETELAEGLGRTWNWFTKSV